MDDKIYNAVMSGKSDNSINFADFQSLIIDLGFIFRRQNGSHMIYSNNNINEYMNIQDKGGKAKDYQVKQLRKIIKRHGL